MNKLLIALLVVVLIQSTANATEHAAANHFVDYWNMGEQRNEITTEVFTQDFIERRGATGLARIMNMLYDDNGDITVHSITSSDAEQITFMASSERDKWMNITLDLAPGLKINAMAVARSGAPPKAEDKNLSSEEVVIRLQQYMADRVAKGEFSGSILLAQNGRPLFAEAYGLADIENGRENTLDTPINLGSMNKMFTGLAVTQLVAQGKLAFTDTVGKHLPDYPNQQVRDRVTIHHLLTHTSGMGSYWTDEYEQRKDSITTVGELAELFVEESLDFEPGAQQQYSNCGPVVLGLIIEEITGQSYYDYIRKHIYTPAGMPHSDHYTKTESASGKANGYFVPDDSAGELVSNEHIRGNIGSPAGGGYASANDLLAFATALYDGTLIDPDYREQMTTAKGSRNDAGGYAYLYQDGRVNGKRYVGHNGGAPGINADFSVFPESGYALVVLSNTNHNASPVADQLRQWIGYAVD